jgi:hypothetical protein
MINTSELISTSYGLERYPNVSLHNGMKSILKDFYLFIFLTKDGNFMLTVISKCVQQLMKYLANTKKENIHSEFIEFILTQCVLGQYPKRRQI